MKRPTRQWLPISIFATVLALTACGSPKAQNHDPRKGDVSVSLDTNKRCDGTTLLYKAAGGGKVQGAVPNSPECAK